MKYLKRLALVAAICLTTACSSNSQSEPKTPVAPLRTAPRRDDLPMNWFKVSGNDWSYGLPLSFSSVKSTKFGALSQHHSMLRQVDVSLSTYKTEMNDVREYVLSDFIMPSMVAGKRVLTTRESNKNPTLPIVAVHLLYNGNNVSVERMHSGKVWDASLDFFVLKDKTVYHMSCFGEAGALKANADVCFQVIDTLQIK
jgi:hypothetical protein